MSWAAGPYLSVDFETTGVDVENDRVVTAAIVDIRPGQPVRTRTWLVNPGIDIPAGATAVHGITTEMARTDGVHPSTALDEISLEIETAIASGIPLVAMNASFDLGKRTLESLCQHYKVTIDGAHNAAADATAACRVLFRIAQQYRRSLGEADLNDLHDKQAGWHAERQNDFAAYREQIGKPLDDISTEWPIRRLAEQQAA